MEACPNLAELSDADYLRELYAKARLAQIPLAASIELTERCNLHCVHCYLGDQETLRSNRSRELDAAQWKGILEQIADLGCLQLLITGGDPLLRQDFARIYRYAKECGLLVTIFTNGTLITPAIVDLFRELPPYAVEISLYGATEQTYERVTAIGGSYGRCLAGIHALRELGIELGLKTVLMKQNRHEFSQIAAMCRAYGNRQFRMDVEIQGGFNDSTPLRTRLDPADAVRVEFTDRERFDIWRSYWQKRKSLRPAHPERLYGCNAGLESFHVDPYGRLQPCLVTRHIAFDLAGGAGSLREAVAFARREIAERKVFYARTCDQCDYRMLCNSCPAFALLEHGDEAYPAEFQCRTTRARVDFIEKDEIGRQ